MEIISLIYCLSWILFFIGYTWVTKTNDDTVLAQHINDLQDEKADKTIVDVRDYGAVGDGVTDDATAIQNAVNSLTSGGVVYIPKGTYKINSEIDLGINVSLVGDGMGITILDFSSAASNGITSYGSTTEPANLDANIVKGDRTVTLDDASGYSEEDIVIIYDAADSSFSTHRTYYRAGEMGVVDHIDGNDLELTSGVFASYTDDADMHIYKVSPTQITLKDFSIKGPGAGAYIGIRLDYGFNCRIENVESYDWQTAAFWLRNCFNCVLAGLNGRSVVNAATIGYDYGLMLASCQGIEISNSFFIGDRHGTTTGNGILTFPCRYLNFHHCQIFNTGRVATYAADCHGLQEYVTFDNCITDSLEIAGNHTKVTNCTIFATLVAAIGSRELVGWDADINNNTVYVVGNVYGMAITSDSKTTIGGTLKINDNIFYMYDTTGARSPFQVLNAGSTASDLRVEMCNNVYSNISGVEQDSAQINVSSGNYFESIKCNNNTFDTYSLVIRQGQAIEVCGNEVKSGGAGFGLDVQINAPTADPTIVKITDNTVYNCEGSGLYIIAGDAGNPCKELVVRDNIIRDNATSAGTRYELYIQYAVNATIDGNIISGSNANLNGLVYIDNVTTVECWNNIFTTTKTSAWTLTNITTYHGQIVVNLADDAEEVLPTTPAGWGKAWGGGEMITFQTTTAAAVTSLVGTSNTAVTDSDTDLCVYDKGTTIGVKNRLGAEKKIYIEMYS